MKQRNLIPRHFTKFYFKDGADAIWKISKDTAKYAYLENHGDVEWLRAAAFASRELRLLAHGWRECLECDIPNVVKRYCCSIPESEDIVMNVNEDGGEDR